MKTIIKHLLILILISAAAGCMKDKSLNLPYEGFVPVIHDDDWVISNPGTENMDGSIIDQVYRDFYNESKYPTIQSLLIIRNGRLVAEAYCKNRNDIDFVHNTMSATKSITSILVGIALDKGLIDSVGTPVYHYLSQFFDEDKSKREITIEQALTMETGLEFDNNIHASELLSCQGSSLRYVLNKELTFAPGTDWYYGNGNPHLLSGIIQQVSGKSEAEFASEYLFEPLGIKDYQWEGLSDGLTYGAQGLWLIPRDMAKIGQLMAWNGIWNGQQVVSEEWVKTSTRNQATHHNYGYYWYPVEDKAFYAEGHGGQIIWAYPEKNLVIVITSDPYARAWELSSGYSEIFSGIVSSLKDSK